MRYTKELTVFIEKMSEKYGVTPDQWEHHVLVPVDGVYEFAYRNESNQWIYLSVYEQCSVDHLINVGLDLQAAIVEYNRGHDFNAEKSEDVVHSGDAMSKVRRLKALNAHLTEEV